MEIIDWKHFRENVLATFGHQHAHDMVVKYHQSALVILESIVEDIERRDQYLHTLIGSSRSIGAYKIADIACAIKEETDSIPSLEDLGQALTASVIELKNYCQQSGEQRAR